MPFFFALLSTTISLAHPLCVWSAPTHRTAPTHGLCYVLFSRHITHFVEYDDLEKVFSWRGGGWVSRKTVCNVIQQGTAASRDDGDCVRCDLLCVYFQLDYLSYAITKISKCNYIRAEVCLLFQILYMWDYVMQK